jgi:exo-1,4-beta-D-glucosaminidase
VYNIPDLTEKYTNHITLSAPAGVSTEAFTLPAISGLSTTYFIRLRLQFPDGSPVGDNLYWYSTQPDVLTYTNSTYYYTPLSSYADLTGLNTLATNNSVTASATTIRVNNPASGSLAFFVRAEVTKGRGGEEVVPVTYNDNYFTLWPGESATITAQYAQADLGGLPAFVRVRGYNVPEILTALIGFKGVTILPGGGSLVQCTGSAGTNYTLQASTNLVNWLDLTNLPAGTNNEFQYLDTSATNGLRRFYRLRWP